MNPILLPQVEATEVVMEEADMEVEAAEAMEAVVAEAAGVEEVMVAVAEVADMAVILTVEV